MTLPIQHTNTRTTTALSIRETRFVNEYIKCMNQGEAAVAAGFKKSSASVSAWKMMKLPHVCLAIAEALEEKAILAKIDASWVLKRLARLADFSIKNFIVVDDNTGRLRYDFAAATADDWYCINEITIGATRAHHNQGDKLWIDEVKIKTGDKMKALELVGKHVDVQAFKDRVDMNGAVVVTEVTRVVVRPEPTPPPELAPHPPLTADGT